MDDLAPHNVIEWDFTPYKPVRPEITGEVVYFKKWVKLMLPPHLDALHAPTNPDLPSPEGYFRTDRYFVENPERENEFPVMNIWRDMGIPNAHDTRIMTNFIVWLGTNSGAEMRGKAQDFIDKNIHQKQAYLLAWNLSNIRARHINHGSIPRDALATKFGDASMAKSPIPKPTMYDIETIENVCLWLGTDQGQDFITACERNRDIKYERTRKLPLKFKTIPKAP